jgi:hypothetical protein
MFTKKTADGKIYLKDLYKQLNTNSTIKKLTDSIVTKGQYVAGLDYKFVDEKTNNTTFSYLTITIPVAREILESSNTHKKKKEIIRKLLNANLKSNYSKLTLAEQRVMLSDLRKTLREQVENKLKESLSKKQLNTILNQRIFNVLHVIVKSETATEQLFKRMKAKKNFDPKSTNADTNDEEKIKKIDHTFAINFYSDKDLNIFLSLYDLVLKNLTVALELNKDISVESLIAILDKTLENIISQHTNFKPGDTFQTRNRKELTKIIYKYIKTNEDVSQDLEDLKNIRTRRLKIK